MAFFPDYQNVTNAYQALISPAASHAGTIDYIRVADATVTVGTRAELLRDHVSLRDVRLTRPLPRDVLAQARAHAAPVAARLERDEVVFAEPQPRVAPGQVVALYDGDLCCGGGIVRQ